MSLEMRIKVLKEYQANEEANCHAENYVLLADYFGDWDMQELARKNMRFRDKHGYNCHKLNKFTHHQINPLYYSELMDPIKAAQN